MIKIVGVLIFLLAGWELQAQPASNSDIARQNIKSLSVPNLLGYLEFLPAGYNTGSKSYPLLISLHGLGQKGKNINEIYKVARLGPPQVIESNANEDMCFSVAGRQECLIVVSPQLEEATPNWSLNTIDRFLDYILRGPENYKIDPNRIYITGHSLGAIGIYEYLVDNLNSPNQFAGVALVAGNGIDQDAKGCIIAERNINIHAYHSEADESPVTYESGLASFNRIANCNTTSSTGDLAFTTYPIGDSVSHDGTADRAYTTTNTYENPNLYEWLLLHTLNGKDSNPITGVEGINENEQIKNIVLSSDDPWFLWRHPSIQHPTITIYNTQGQLITQTIMLNNMININYLKAGLYLYHIQDDSFKTVQSGRIVKLD